MRAWCQFEHRAAETGADRSADFRRVAWRRAVRSRGGMSASVARGRDEAAIVGVVEETVADAPMIRMN